MSPLRVVLCDDEEMVLEALSMAVEALGIQVVAATPDPALALGLVHEHRPDVCVLDAHFPDGSGPDVAAQMHAEAPDTAIIMLTADADEAVWAAYDDGTLRAVLNKTLDCDTLESAITALSRGERLVIGWRRRTQPFRRPDVEPLTGRELDVLAALVRGAGTSDIALELAISAHTVRTHVQNVMRKLGVTTRAKATQVAVAHGLLVAS